MCFGGLRFDLTTGMHFSHFPISRIAFASVFDIENGNVDPKKVVNLIVRET